MDVTAPAPPLAVASPAAAPPAAAGARGLLAIVAVGIVVAALTFRVGDAGPGWLAADAALVVAILAGVGRGRPGGAAWLLGAVSVWLAGVTCWRASDWALATALPGSLLALMALGLVAARRTEASRVIDVAGASLAALRALPRGVVDAARMPARALGAPARSHAVGIVRGLLLGGPIAVAFAVLLAADSSFRRALARLLERAGDGVDLALWTAGTTAALLVAFAVLRRVEAPARREPVRTVWPSPYRVEGDALAWTPPPAPTGPRLRPLTWGVALAQVVAVFAVYAGATAGSLFEGHAHLQARGTETYSEYLHQGFTQVSIAALLAVACVVGGHLLLRPRGGGGPVAGGRGLAAVELALLSLVGLTLASCAHRLALYEQVYGYTYLRLGVWLLQLGVAGLLSATAARCVARGRRGWGSALAWSAVAFGTVAASLDADGWIARHNVERARAGRPLDVEYMETLSEDARAVLPDVAALDRDAESELESVWSAEAAAHRSHGWRSLRGLGAR